MNDVLLNTINKETGEDLITDDIVLYRGDCLKVMNNIADNSVDLILCDLSLYIFNF